MISFNRSGDQIIEEFQSVIHTGRSGHQIAVLIRDRRRLAQNRRISVKRSNNMLRISFQIVFYTVFFITVQICRHRLNETGGIIVVLSRPCKRLQSSCEHCIAKSVELAERCGQAVIYTRGSVSVGSHRSIRVCLRTQREITLLIHKQRILFKQIDIVNNTVCALMERDPVNLAVGVFVKFLCGRIHLPVNRLSAFTYRSHIPFHNIRDIDKVSVADPCVIIHAFIENNFSTVVIKGIDNRRADLHIVDEYLNARRIVRIMFIFCPFRKPFGGVFQPFLAEPLIKVPDIQLHFRRVDLFAFFNEEVAAGHTCREAPDRQKTSYRPLHLFPKHHCFPPQLSCVSPKIIRNMFQRHGNTNFHLTIICLYYIIELYPIQLKK